MADLAAKIYPVSLFCFRPPLGHDAAHRATRAHQTSPNVLDREHEAAEKDVRIYEEKLEIPAGQRWTPVKKERHGALMYIYQRRFSRAFDQLERSSCSD